MQRSFVGTALVFLAGLLVGGSVVFFNMRSSPERAQSASAAFDLKGEWEADLPAGFKMSSAMIPMGKGRYRLPALGVFSGVYELDGDRLVVVEPDDERLDEFVWLVED